jgi:hypothetical protein
MHNRPDMNNKRPVAIAARRAFASEPGVGSVFVADERTTRISHLPLEPHHTTKPGWEYPTTFLARDKPWTMRRYALLVEHSPRESKIPDYLVIRDEIDSPEPVWWNLHVLARDIQETGIEARRPRKGKPGVKRYFFPGQLDVDLTAHFFSPGIRDIERREWGWSNERKSSSRRTLKGEAYEKEHFGRYIPKDFQRGRLGASRQSLPASGKLEPTGRRSATWGKSFEHSGEMTKWLRLKSDAGRTNWLVVLVPHRQGQAAPKVEKLSDTSARVSLGEEAEIVHLGSEGKHQAAIERGERQRVLLKAAQVKPWSQLEFRPIPPNIDKGAL